MENIEFLMAGDFAIPVYGSGSVISSKSGNGWLILMFLLIVFVFLVVFVNEKVKEKEDLLS